MAVQYPELNQQLIEFIDRQYLYFVGTAGAEGRVNVSPKGMDSFRVVSPSEVVWLNLTGSGNETAAHVLENSRMTIMFCSFERQPLVLRLYGQAQAVHPRDVGWSDLIGLFPEHAGARQIFRLQLDLVQTSCGYAVPHMNYEAERTTLQNWAEKRGEEGVRQYWQERNQRSLDDRETGILPLD